MSKNPAGIKPTKTEPLINCSVVKRAVEFGTIDERNLVAYQDSNEEVSEDGDYFVESNSSDSYVAQENETIPLNYFAILLELGVEPGDQFSNILIGLAMVEENRPILDSLITKLGQVLNKTQLIKVLSQEAGGDFQGSETDLLKGFISKSGVNITLPSFTLLPSCEFNSNIDSNTNVETSLQGESIDIF